MIKFEKIERKSFLLDTRQYMNIPELEAKRIYDDLKMPFREDDFSAGYDFYAPFDIVLDGRQAATKRGQNRMDVLTGILCNFGEFGRKCHLEIYPDKTLARLDGVVFAEGTVIYDAKMFLTGEQIILPLSIVSEGKTRIMAGTKIGTGVIVQHGYVMQ